MTKSWSQKVATRLRWQYPVVYAMIVLELRYQTLQDARAKRQNKTKWAREHRAALRAEKTPTPVTVEKAEREGGL